jgi:hypothetical protein
MMSYRKNYSVKDSLKNGALPFVESAPVQPAMPRPEPVVVLTKQHACALLHIAEATIGRWAKNDPTFPSTGNGGRWRIIQADLLDWHRNRKKRSK